MRNIGNLSRPVATLAASLLVCAVAAGCSKKEQARTNAAASDTTLRSSQGGTVPIESVSVSTSTTIPPATSANQQPSAERTTTSSQGGTVRARRTAVAGASVASASRRNANSAAGVTRADDPRGGSATPASEFPTPVPETFLAEPQIFNVVLLGNIGDSVTSARAVCLNPAGASAFDAQVRNYAQQMVRDHAQLNQRVVSAQRARSVIPTRSEVSDGVFSANTDAMYRNESPREYIAREVQAHQNMLNTLDTKLIPNARDSSLRNLLTDARTVVMNHLVMAQQIQNGEQASLSITPQPLSTSSPPQTLSVSVTPPVRDSAVRGESMQPAPSAATKPAQPDVNTVTVQTTQPAWSQPSTVTANPGAPSIISPTNSPSATPAVPCERPAGTTMNMINASPMQPDTSRGYDSRSLSDPARTPANTAPTPEPRKP